MATFGENLRKYINEKRLSTTRFAGMCGMNVTTMSNYINGTRLPDALAVKKILDTVPNLSADFLYGRNVPMFLDAESAPLPKENAEENTDNSCDSKLLKQVESQQSLIEHLMNTLVERDQMIKELISAKTK